MNHPKLTVCPLSLLRTFAALSHAQDGLPITVSGFGTAAVTSSDTNPVEFARVSQGQPTDAVGLRRDFYKSAAFKAQADRVKPRSGNDTFINVKPGFTDRDMPVYAAAIDFVF